MPKLVLSTAHSTLHSAGMENGKWKNAIPKLKQSIAHVQDSPHNWLFIAMSHKQLNAPDEAQQWFEKASAGKTEHPGWPPILSLNAFLLKQQKKQLCVVNANWEGAVEHSTTSGTGESEATDENLTI